MPDSSLDPRLLDALAAWLSSPDGAAAELPAAEVERLVAILVHAAGPLPPDDPVSDPAYAQFYDLLLAAAADDPAGHAGHAGTERLWQGLVALGAVPRLDP